MIDATSVGAPLIETKPTKFIFVGTGHIFEKSVEDIKKAIKEEQPTIVAVELDEGRFAYLKEKLRNPNMKRRFDLSFIGLLNWLFASLQKSLSFDLEPGVDMITAIQQAQQRNLPLKLVDRHIYTTMNHFISIPWKEKMKLLLPKKIAKSDIRINSNILSDFSQLEKITDLLKKEAPSIYQVFVEERDFFIAHQLFRIFQQTPVNQKILVVLGAGHLAGVKKYFNQFINHQITEQDVRKKMIEATEIHKPGILSVLSLIPLFIVLLILLVFVKLRVIKVK
ncbi:MAG: hypothetical protein CVU81_02930 [Euryarchaeota archaeon HGW-Euryarchaeota-1]|nr:MAG: hypothetical protein CVU81_02930 [Euryarchaeota archaeon HGW-Euryarchaeota-1]